ncbi:hypothetical protein B7463_g11091, partial [Scytalidium lignicola]
MASILDSVSRLIHQHPASTNPSFLVVITVFTTLTAITVSRLIFREEKVKIIKGPATTLLPKLTDAEKALLPYPPDALPGARDVESPYGTTRVYEWGPEDGRKVLLIHGITPPCLALGAIARGLVEKGCRVMLFDGWGRGYSDSPADLPHDERLYASQILIAITSSPLSWTGGPDGGFSLIGYSLGGGISMTFTSYFPHLVNSLVLLVPTSLIRESRIGAQKYMRQVFKIVPERFLVPLLKKRLQKPLFPKENADIATSEIAAPPKLASASLKYPHISALSAVHWNVQTHDGFIRSFISNALYAPGAKQYAAWKRLGLQKRTILIVTATQDPIVVPEELKPDVEELLQGAEAKVEWRSVEGAHNICDTAPEEIVGHIYKYSGLQFLLPPTASTSTLTLIPSLPLPNLKPQTSNLNPSPPTHQPTTPARWEDWPVCGTDIPPSIVEPANGAASSQTIANLVIEPSAGRHSLQRHLNSAAHAPVYECD